MEPNDKSKGIFRMKGQTHGLVKTRMIANLLIIVLILAGMAWSFSRSDDDDDDWSNDGLPDNWPPENVDATTTIGPDNEVAVAVNPTDPDNLIAGSKDYALGPSGNGYIVWAGYFYSRDSGEPGGMASSGSILVPCSRTTNNRRI